MKKINMENIMKGIHCFALVVAALFAVVLTSLSSSSVRIVLQSSGASNIDVFTMIVIAGFAGCALACIVSGLIEKYLHK